MPVSAVIAEKWDRRLYNWLLWQSAGGSGGSGAVRISSAYRGRIFGRGYRVFSAASAVSSGEAMDTDRLLHEVRRRAPACFDALIAWASDDGDRGQQAARLSIHRSTYYDRVDAGRQLLEELDRAKFHKRRPAVQK